MSNLPERLRLAYSELRANAKVYRNIRRLVPFARMNPAKLAQEWAETTPHAPALIFEEQRYSWSELNQEANRYASVFRRRGIRAGHVVALLMTNRPDFLFSLLGLNKLGAVGALINANLRGPELVHAINIADPRAVLVGDELGDALAEIASELITGDLWVHVEKPSAKIAVGTPINDEIDGAPYGEMSVVHTPRNSEVFCYIYTSGTTGLPKAALITNQREVAAGTVFGEIMLESGTGERTYVSLPLYHSSAMFLGWGSAMAMGGSIALARKFSASRFWEDVRKYDCTSFLYIGELCRYLLNTPPHPDERQHRLKVGVGNGLRPDIWEEFQERFGVPVMREFYGATEGNAPVLNFDGRPGMIGRRRRGQHLVRCDLATGEVIRNSAGFCEEIQPGETGLLLGKITRVMKFEGYVDKKATSKKIVENVFEEGDRFFNSGDLIQLHENGWLSFVDRVGDTFRWKGENVSTNEVAEMLNRVEGVLEANVYGVRVPHTDGRAGMAAISVDGNFDLQRLADYANDRLPNYQRPYFVRLLNGDEMRTTTTFKHKKVDYREEGFDPRKVSDPLYFLQNGRYIAIDEALFAKIEAGEVLP